MNLECHYCYAPRRENSWWYYYLVYRRCRGVLVYMGHTYPTEDIRVCERRRLEFIDRCERRSVYPAELDTPGNGGKEANKFNEEVCDNGNVVSSVLGV